MGTCCIAQWAQFGALWWPRGLGCRGGEKEAQEGGDVCIYIGDSLWCTAEMNTIL